MKLVVMGGYGTFGSLVAQELAYRGVNVVIAGRDAAKAEAFAGSLGSQHSGTFVDVADLTSCRAALKDTTVAVNCAGPFNTLGTALLDACLAEHCHYVDIADDRGYVQKVRSYSERFRNVDRAAVYGCSSLPGISGALAIKACSNIDERPQRARVTLFIGNKNPKGVAAVRSLVGGLGKPLAAPQGVLGGFADREVVSLPPPFGRRGVFNFDSPEYDLFPDLLGVRSVSVKVGFELGIATYALAAMACLSTRWGRRSALLLTRCGNWFRRLGNSGGAVMTEVFWADGTVRRASLHTSHHGQRMAALPCAFAAHAMCEQQTNASGALTVYELLGSEALLRGLTAEGFELTVANKLAHASADS